DIGSERDDFALVGVLQPFQNDRCVKPARIGEDDFFDFAHGYSHAIGMCAPILRNRLDAIAALKNSRIFYMRAGLQQNVRPARSGVGSDHWRPSTRNSMRAF